MIIVIWWKCPAILTVKVDTVILPGLLLRNQMVTGLPPRAMDTALENLVPQAP